MSGYGRDQGERGGYARPQRSQRQQTSAPQPAVQDPNAPPIPEPMIHFEIRGQNENMKLVKFTVDESFPNTVPHDIRDMLNANHSLELCKLTAVTSTRNDGYGNASVNCNRQRLEQEVQAHIESANEFGGHPSAKVVMGRSGFVVPVEVADQAFTLEEVTQLMNAKRVVHFMLDGVATQEATKWSREMLDRSDAWGSAKETTQVAALYHDGKVGLFNHGADGALTPAPITPALQKKQKYLQGAAADKRAGFTTLETGGRAVTPDCNSEDFRIYGERTLSMQRTTNDATYHRLTGANGVSHTNETQGWIARVSSTTEYDHATKRRTPDHTVHSVSFTRPSLHTHAVPSPPEDGNAYVVYVGVFLCIGEPVDFQLLIFEHAPQEDTALAAPLEMKPATSTLMVGVDDARACVCAVRASSQVVQTAAT